MFCSSNVLSIITRIKQICTRWYLVSGFSVHLVFIYSHYSLKWMLSDTCTDYEISVVIISNKYNRSWQVISFLSTLYVITGRAGVRCGCDRVSNGTESISSKSALFAYAATTCTGMDLKLYPQSAQFTYLVSVFITLNHFVVIYYVICFIIMSFINSL